MGETRRHPCCSTSSQWCSPRTGFSPLSKIGPNETKQNADRPVVPSYQHPYLVTFCYDSIFFAIVMVHATFPSVMGGPMQNSHSESGWCSVAVNRCLGTGMFRDHRFPVSDHNDAIYLFLCSLLVFLSLPLSTFSVDLSPSSLPLKPLLICCHRLSALSFWSWPFFIFF